MHGLDARGPRGIGALVKVGVWTSTWFELNVKKLDSSRLQASKKGEQPAPQSVFDF